MASSDSLNNFGLREYIVCGWSAEALELVLPPKISLLFYTELSSAAAQNPSALAVTRKKSHRNTTHRLRLRSLMVARSVGVDSQNRALRLKERRKLETESAGRHRGRGGEGLRATAAIHFPDGREISAFRCGRRSLPSQEMTMMVASRRARPWSSTCKGSVRGTNFAKTSLSSAICARPPRCLLPRRTCDVV